MDTSVSKNEKIVTSNASATRRVLLLVASVVGVVSFAFAMFSMHADPFQHETHRLLQEIQQAKGIHLTLTPKENSSLAPDNMLIHGFLFPNTNTTSGTLSFDGRISYVLASEQYNFTLLDGRGYVTEEDQTTGKVIRHACLHPRNLPPLSQFTDSLANARVIDDVASSNIKCDDGKLIEFVFAGEPFVYCYKSKSSVTATSASVNFDTIHSETMEANVQFLRTISDGFPSRNALKPPSDLDLAKCEKLDVDTSSSDDLATSLKKQVGAVVAATTRRTQDAFTFVAGDTRTGSYDSSGCSCSGGMKACLFVHGLGKQGTVGVFDDFPEYWGEIKSKAKCCSSIKFMRMDTVNNAWYADTLPQQMCDAAVSLSKSSDKMQLTNIALIGHSMGNLIIAAAAIKNMCAIGPSSKWIALQGPVIGSKSSNVAVKECTTSSNILKKAAIEVLTLFNFCPVKTSTRSLTFEQTSPTSGELNGMYEKAEATFQKYVTSSLCGVSPAGLASTKSAKYVLLASISGHTTDENDGAVDFNSCRGGFPTSKYGDSWRNNNFYKASLNHADGSFREGDGMWGDDRKPIQWFNCQF
ncbi:hypothetical protein FI667_g17165, partial [Globisporangium splendens]